MNTETHQPSPELERLLSELLDGKLDEPSRLALCELLRNNPFAQDIYRRMIAVHALLHLDLGSGRQMTLRPLLASSPLFDTPSSSSSCGTCAEVVAEIDAHLESRHFKLNETSIHAAAHVPTGRSRWRRVAASTAIAASLLFAVWLLSPFQSRQERAREAAREEFILRDARGVAVLAQAADASWSHTDDALEVGGPLSAGRFKLERGLVQIEFFSGATVVVEAPADFELTTPMELICHLGKIRANVPSQAHGFKIETPKYSAVDLGTEFTVHVGNNGESEIHVLDGEVELWDRQPKAGALAQLLTTGRGVRSTPDGELSPIVNSASSFFGSQECLVRSQAVSQERFENWKTFSNEIRNDPRVLLYCGFDGHAPWERVLRNDSLNGETLDGAIVGCQWTTGRWNGKQALEFKRTSDRVRLNIPGQFESLSFAAWVRIEGLERWLSSLMLTDGHQPGEIHWQMTELGQMMLGVKAEVDQSHDFYSPSVLSPRDLGRWVHLGCVYNGAKGYVAHYVDGAEISREKVRIPTKLIINAAEIGNWVPEDMLDNRVRSLNGRMDEFIVFDGPLSKEEMSEIYEAGKLQ